MQSCSALEFNWRYAYVDHVGGTCRVGDCWLTRRLIGGDGRDRQMGWSRPVDRPRRRAHRSPDRGADFQPFWDLAGPGCNINIASEYCRRLHRLYDLLARPLDHEGQPIELVLSFCIKLLLDGAALVGIGVTARRGLNAIGKSGAEHQ